MAATPPVSRCIENAVAVIMKMYNSMMVNAFVVHQGIKFVYVFLKYKFHPIIITVSSGLRSDDGLFVGIFIFLYI